MAISKLPTREAMNNHREFTAQNGVMIPLTATSIGYEEVMEGRFRRLSTLDKASINMLPQHMQETVFAGMKEFERMQKASTKGEDPQSLLEAMAKNQEIVIAANGYCIAAFLSPILVATENDLAEGAQRAKEEAQRLYDAGFEAEEPPVWLVEDLAAEDRVSVMAICLDSDSAQVAKLKRFRPERRGHANTGDPQPVAPAPIRPAEPTE